MVKQFDMTEKFGFKIYICEHGHGRLETNTRKNNKELRAIESLVLAHACAGVNVMSEEYQKGLEVAYESLCQ